MLNFPPWVLLDTVARTGRCKNETTAQGTTSAGLHIEVSFELVDPPGLSRCVVHCPESSDQTAAGNSSIAPPSPSPSACVTGADGAFLLVRVFFPERDGRRPMLTDVFFVYRAGPAGTPPSLNLLPRPYPARLHSCHVGVLSSADDGGEHCSVVVPERRVGADRRVRYDLQVFSTRTASWSTKDPRVSCNADRLYGEFEPTKVFSVGGGSLAWVDLQFGILLCKDLDEDPEMRLIQLPPLMPGNRERFGVDSDGSSPPMDPIRDVTFRNGWFRFIEMEFLKLGDDRHDDSATALQPRWTATVFKREIWERCSTVDSDLSPADDSCLPCLVPEIYDQEEEKLTLNKVVSSVPTLDQYRDDVVYMVSELKAKDTHGWIIAVSTENKTLGKVVPFSAERLYFHRAYLQCAFSKHLMSDD